MYVCMYVKVEIAAKVHVGYHGGSAYSIPTEDDLKQVLKNYYFIYKLFAFKYVCMCRSKAEPPASTKTVCKTVQPALSTHECMSAYSG